MVFCTLAGRQFTHVDPPGSLVLKIWNRVVQVHASESVLVGVVNVCSRLPHHVDVFSWIWKSFFIWDVIVVIDVLRGVDF